MICKVCKERIEKGEYEKHFIDHIETSYQNEERTFQETQRLRVLYKKLFNKDI